MVIRRVQGSWHGRKLYELDQPQSPSAVCLLHWLLPFLLGSLAVLYEIGPGRWIHDGNVSTYFDLDMALERGFVSVWYPNCRLVSRQPTSGTGRPSSLSNPGERRARLAATGQRVPYQG